MPSGRIREPRDSLAILARRRTAKDAAQVIGDRVLFRERLAARFQLALHHAELGENAVPVRFQPADLFVRKFADTTHRHATLENIHRPSRKIRQYAQRAENMLGFLQKIRPDLRELPFLFG